MPFIHHLFHSRPRVGTPSPKPIGPLAPCPFLVCTLLALPCRHRFDVCGRAVGHPPLQPGREGRCGEEAVHARPRIDRLGPPLDAMQSNADTPPLFSALWFLNPRRSSPLFCTRESPYRLLSLLLRRVTLRRPPPSAPSPPLECMTGCAFHVRRQPIFFFFFFVQHNCRGGRKRIASPSVTERYRSRDG